MNLSRISRCITRLTSPTTKSSKKLSFANFELPSDVLPSIQLVNEFDKKIKEKMAQRLVELEFLYRISAEVPQKLCIENWLDLCEIPSVREREFYLRSIYYNELGKEKCQQNNTERLAQFRKWFDKEKERFENGEMVYGSSFYNLYSCIRGNDFRQMIDRLHGCKFWESARLNEPLTKLIIDCRNLHKSTYFDILHSVKQIQTVYENNWASRNPFEIIIANFFVDEAIGRAIKKHWHFLFGPPSSRYLNSPFDEVEDRSVKFSQTEFQKEDDSDEYDFSKKQFSPHPFIPLITTRGLWDAIGKDVQPVKKQIVDEVAYLSPKAKKFLELSGDASKESTCNNFDGSFAGAQNTKIKVFVTAAFDDSTTTWHQSVSGAMADKISSFRLPWGSGNKPLPLSRVVSILGCVVNDGCSWNYAFQKYIAKNNVEPVDTSHVPARNSLRILNNEKRKRRIQLLEEMTNQLTQQRINSLPESARMPKSAMRALNRHKAHKYTREERKEMRLRNLKEKALD